MIWLPFCLLLLQYLPCLTGSETVKQKELKEKELRKSLAEVLQFIELLLFPEMAGDQNSKTLNDQHYSEFVNHKTENNEVGKHANTEEMLVSYMLPYLQNKGTHQVAGENIDNNYRGNSKTTIHVTTVDKDRNNISTWENILNNNRFNTTTTDHKSTVDTSNIDLIPGDVHKVNFTTSPSGSRVTDSTDSLNSLVSSEGWKITNHGENLLTTSEKISHKKTKDSENLTTTFHHRYPSKSSINGKVNNGDRMFITGGNKKGSTHKGKDNYWNTYENTWNNVDHQLGGNVINTEYKYPFETQSNGKNNDLDGWHEDENRKESFDKGKDYYLNPIGITGNLADENLGGQKDNNRIRYPNDYTYGYGINTAAPIFSNGYTDPREISKPSKNVNNVENLPQLVSNIDSINLNGQHGIFLIYKHTLKDLCTKLNSEVDKQPNNNLMPTQNFGQEENMNQNKVKAKQHRNRYQHYNPINYDDTYKHPGNFDVNLPF